jgi:hypothetical protein
LCMASAVWSALSNKHRSWLRLQRRIRHGV